MRAACVRVDIRGVAETREVAPIKARIHAMQLTSEEQQRLARIGWRTTPLPGDAPAGGVVARVVAQHRAGYQLHDGTAMFKAQPAARFLKRDLDPTERPAVGDFVTLGAGCKILGGIRLGDRVTVGANSVVLDSVESDNTVVGIPARKLSLLATRVQ